MRSSAKYIWIFLVIFFVGGFLLAETSGLLGRAPITTSTAVATVNGEDVLATTWFNATSALEQQATQNTGKSVTLDERKRFGDQAFDQLVGETLLRQEYRRRGITVSDDEIATAARMSPPPELLQNTELQTEGRFDPAKYQRFLASPAARQEGLLFQLEQYYRDAIPREKLFEQIASDVYVSDDRLWQIWQDTHDTTQISYVAFRADMLPDTGIVVSDADIKEYYDKNKKDFERPGRAVVSVLVIPRTPTAADTSTARQKILALRDRIAKGEKFEDLAKTESADSTSGAQGGSLGKGTRGRFVPPFEDALFKLKVGELSQPVLTPFGFHLIRVDERKGDTITARHILLKIAQSDSAAVATDRRADELARIAASSDKPGKLEEAAKKLGLTIKRGTAVESDALVIDGKFIPSVGPWVFGGAKAGETSELFDADDGYYIARLESITPGGIPSLEQAKADIRPILAVQKKLDRLMPRAAQFAAEASKDGLEKAAAQAGLSVTKSASFTRVGGAEGLGRLNEAIGAAFSLPIDGISTPIRTHDGIFVERVDQRVLSDKSTWEKQKAVQRAQVTSSLREQRIREFLTNLRENAKITDRRKEIEAANRTLTQ